MIKFQSCIIKEVSWAVQRTFQPWMIVWRFWSHGINTLNQILERPGIDPCAYNTFSIKMNSRLNSDKRCIIMSHKFELGERSNSSQVHFSKTKVKPLPKGHTLFARCLPAKQSIGQFGHVGKTLPDKHFCLSQKFKNTAQKICLILFVLQWAWQLYRKPYCNDEKTQVFGKPCLLTDNWQPSFPNKSKSISDYT